jgi:hypothetical protein
MKEISCSQQQSNQSWPKLVIMCHLAHSKYFVQLKNIWLLFDLSAGDYQLTRVVLRLKVAKGLP